jgi:diketogulonate reductase-like aldo/keto reductase
MQRRPFGPAETPVPIIGQGTWYDENADFNAVSDALRHGLDLGMTHIDAAEMYGSGLVEEVAGEMKRRRDEVFLVSKVLPQNASAARGEDPRVGCEQFRRARPG